MLTTRELSAGQMVEIAGIAATVTEVTEAYFAAVAPTASTLPIGQNGSSIRVTLTRDHEARYETRCTLLAKQAGENSQRLVFAHDEHPNRIQLRKAVRVTVRGSVRLNPAHGRPSGDVSGARDRGEDEMELGKGSLLDISVGGAALDTTVQVPVGSTVRLSFVLDGVAYDELLAFVLECQLRKRGLHHMRVQFRNLAQADEARLAASVARYSAHPFTEPVEPT
jgi:c-di-GMP-binding flagellar brake protein YcgR